MRIDSPHRRGLDVGDGRTRLMGVLNITPDSFSDGGHFLAPDAAVRQGKALVEAGADVIDLGAESTRPGYAGVPPDEQLSRLLPVLTALRGEIDVPISIDTTRATVASAALEAGADWINDTTALTEDPELAAVVAEHRCPVVLMHRFVPARTAADPGPSRASVMTPIVSALQARVEFAIAQGIDESRILLDPGIGFGTLAADNTVIHAHIADLQRLGRPIVAGPSRKSFLGHLTGRETGERLPATAACVAILATAGVDLVRVHDVSEMRDVVIVADAIRRAQEVTDE